MGYNVEGLVGVGSFFSRACSPSLYTAVALLIGFLVYYYAPYWRVRKLPGPPATFLVGHLPLLAKYGPDALRIVAKKYGPIFRFHLGRQPLVIIADPELCREVGIKNFKDIRNRSSLTPASGSPLHQEGLFLTRDSRWSAMRNTITSLYQPSHLSSLIPTMQSYVESLSLNLSTAQEGEDIVFSELTLRMAIDVIGKTAFGVEFHLTEHASSQKSLKNHYTDDTNDEGDDEVSGFLKQHTYSIESLKMDLSGSFSTILGLIAPVLQKPCRELLKRIPGTADYKLYRNNQKLCKRIDAVIAKRSKEITHDSKDFLAAVLKARESGGGKELFTHNYIRALTYEHLLAGAKTTAFTLASTVYLVAKHPEVEKKLLQEIDSFGPHDVIPTAKDLQDEFPYMDQIVHSIKAAREVIRGGKKLLREMQDRAEAAEKALEEIKESCASEVRAAEGKAEIEANRARAAISQMMESESAVMARNIHISELTEALREAEERAGAASEEARAAREEAEVAKEEVGQYKEEISRVRETERDAVEALAAEKTRAAKLVEEYRSSERYTDDLAEASAAAFLDGFQYAKEKVAKDLDFPRALEVEPESSSDPAPSDDEPAPAEP